MQIRNHGFSLIEVMIALAIAAIITRGLTGLLKQMNEQKTSISARLSSDELGSQVFSLFQRDVGLIRKHSSICQSSGWCSAFSIPFYEGEAATFRVSCHKLPQSIETLSTSLAAISSSSCMNSSACPQGTIPMIQYFRSHKGKNSLIQTFPSSPISAAKDIRSKPIAASLCARTEATGTISVAIDIIYIDRSNKPAFLSKTRNFSNINFGGIQHVE